MTTLTKIPRRLPLLVIDHELIVPGSRIAVSVTSPKAITLFKESILNGLYGDEIHMTDIPHLIGVIPKETWDVEQKSEVDAPTGTVASVSRVMEIRGTATPLLIVYLLGLCHFKLKSVIKQEPYLVGEIELDVPVSTTKVSLVSGHKSKYPVMPIRGIVGDRKHPGGRKGDETIDELHKKLKAAGLPEHAQKVAFKELSRLEKLPSISPETGIIEKYLDLMAELPWSKSSPETLDIKKARLDMDADHYAMDKLKQRILEYLAVRQLKNSLRGPILCFVGPPGVGKTSIGRSIALTLGRKFHRISLGGVCNQSDIRGHRRTYIGAMSGRIIQGLKIVGVNNPVMLLDEIDKLSHSSQGDPASALLEVLDPEQNCNFTDHYLNVPFDLSQVMFIATANTTKTIPPALLDRMEVIHVPGYSQEEKLHITIRHLLPKLLTQHGLDETMFQIQAENISDLISDYTREAGVRNLERKLAALCRAVAVRVAESGEGLALPVVIDRAMMEDILGPPAHSSKELQARLGLPGLAVGLAWTASGGEVLLVEAGRMEGDGELVLTGRLGQVMRESAQLALTWVRTAAPRLGLRLDGEVLAHTDIHIHFPEGAVDKDGPSAGVTIITALVSLLADRPIALDVAMTGEVTLRGVVLPVGGIKEKVLAAHRAGFRKIVLPRGNRKNLPNIPQNVQKEIDFVFVSHVDEVLAAAFEGGFPTTVIEDIVSKL